MTAKKTTRKLQAKTSPATKWYAMRCFKKDDKNDVGFLGISKSKKHAYKIVDDAEDALKFPSENVLSANGFGTPKQWLEFFKNEPELKDWKFHLVRTRR